MNHSPLMSYHEFFSTLSHAILQELGSNYETHPVTNAKNNGIRRNGIVIRYREEKTAPTIYLDAYYQDYRSGRVLSDIVRHVLYTYHESSAESTKYQLDNIELTTEYVQKNVISCIVSYEKNKDILQEIPHIRLFDLAVFFKLLVYQNENGIGTVRFTREHYKLFFADSEVQNETEQLLSLYRHAVKNTREQFPARFYVLADMMEGMVSGKEARPISLADHPDGKRAPLYVLTNSKGIGGASCILYPELFEQIYRYLNSDFFLIPSSIHEVLIMPDQAKIQRDQLNDMIKEINLTEVPMEDVLSDTAYHSTEWKKVLTALLKQTGSLPCIMNP